MNLRNSVRQICAASILTVSVGWMGAQANTVLEEVVVTAQKRSENLQDVPSSVTALRGEKLDVLSSAGADIRFLSARVPSLTIESSFGRTFPRFYIRGLGNTDFDLNASQPVSLVYDEVVLENPLLKGFPVFDLERVEVLRGPQGTLFGRNTPAGIVKFDSAKPSQERSGYAMLAYGRYNALDFEGAAGGALTDTLSVRVSGMYQTRDNWIDNTFTNSRDALGGYDEVAIRTQFLYEPSDDLDILLNVHARHLNGTARVFRANAIRAGTNDLVADFERDQVAHDGQNSQELEELGFVFTVNYNLGSTTLTTVTGYESLDLLTRGDIDGGFGAVFAPPFGPGFIPFTSETADGVPELDQFTQEFRLSSNDWETFNFQVGFFYFTEDLAIDSFSYCTLCGGTQDGYARQNQNTDSWALFGSFDVDVTEKLSFSAGVRFSDDEKKFVADRLQSPFGSPLAPIHERTSDGTASWNLSATYAVEENINLYGRIATGFRAPSIQGRVLFGDVVTVADTETIISYEAGMKAEFLDGRARVNFSAFFYEMDDQQLTAVGGGANFNQLVNADDTEGRGYELDVDWLLTDNLLVTVGASFNHTEINDPNLFIQPCGGGCTVLDPVSPTDPTLVSIDGNPLPHAPEWIANFTLRYGIPMANGNEFYIYTDWAYRSEINFFLYEAIEFTGDPLVEGGLRLGYLFNKDKYEVAAYVRNITDEENLEGGIDFNNLTGFLNEPRQFGIEGRISF